MKLVSYYKDGQDQLAILADGLLYDADLMHPDLPVSMAMFLNYWEDFSPILGLLFLQWSFFISFYHLQSDPEPTFQK